MLDIDKIITDLVESEVVRESEVKLNVYRKDGGRKMAIAHATLTILQAINRELSADRHRIEYLETIKGTYTGKTILRMSSDGRGFRLHETSREGAKDTVREAIDAHMAEHPELVEKIIP